MIIPAKTFAQKFHTRSLRSYTTKNIRFRPPVKKASSPFISNCNVKKWGREPRFSPTIFKQKIELFGSSSIIYDLEANNCPHLHDNAWSKAIVLAFHILVIRNVCGIFSGRFFRRWLLHNGLFDGSFFDHGFGIGVGLFRNLLLALGREQPANGFGWGRKHFGSLVFGSLLFAFVFLDKLLDAAFGQRPGRMICFEFFGYVCYDYRSVVLGKDEKCEAEKVSCSTSTTDSANVIDSSICSISSNANQLRSNLHLSEPVQWRQWVLNLRVQ